MKKSCMVKYVIRYLIFVTPYMAIDVRSGSTDVTSACNMLAASWCIGALKRRPNEGRPSLPGRITHQPESRATFSTNRRMQLKQASLSTAASRMPSRSVSMALFVLSDFQFFLPFLFSPSFPRLPYVLILSPLLASFNPPSLTSSLAPRWRTFTPSLPAVFH